jgi:multidrug transporter EmrE-like cation transporter
MRSYLLLLPAMIWLIIGILTNTYAEYTSKIWAINPAGVKGHLYMVWVLLVYTVGSICFLCALLHRNEIAVMGLTWQVLSMVGTIFLGIFIFHETITIHQYIGMFLAGLAVLLINW